MPLDTHLHLCCANSQTAMPHHVSSRTHPPRLRTPAEHPTRLYLPAKGQSTPECTSSRISTVCLWRKTSVAMVMLLRISIFWDVTGLVLLVYEGTQSFHLQKLRSTKMLLSQVLDSPRIIILGPLNPCIIKHYICSNGRECQQSDTASHPTGSKYSDLWVSLTQVRLPVPYVHWCCNTQYNTPSHFMEVQILAHKPHNLRFCIALLGSSTWITGQYLKLSHALFFQFTFRWPSSHLTVQSELSTTWMYEFYFPTYEYICLMNPGRARDVSLLHMSIPALKHTNAFSIHTGHSCPCITAAGSWCWPTPSGTNIKNAYSHTSSPHACLHSMQRKTVSFYPFKS